MKTWIDVLRVFVSCLGAIMAALFLITALMWAWETDMEIAALQADMEILKAKQRPLVAIDGGKYLNVFTKEKEVVIEVVETKEVDRSRW